VTEWFTILVQNSIETSTVERYSRRRG